jgi:hypothetical protein
MPDAEKSLLFVIKANIEDYNKKIGDAERNFKRSFGNIQKQLETTSRQFMMLGGVITAAFVGATLKFADTADKLVEMSQRTGIGVEALQELGFAAKLSGSSLEGLETSVKRMQVAISNSSPAFKDLGISLAELRTLSPDQQLKKVLTAIAAIPDPTKRAAAAIDIFGKSGTDLLPMLEGGAAGLQKMIDRAHELGLVFSPDTVKAAADLKDSFDALGMQFQALLGHIAQTAAFGNLINNFSNLLALAMNWIDKHPELVRAFMIVGGAILAVGIALKAMAIGMALVQALSGVGIAQVLIGLAAGAAAALVINKLMVTPALETPVVPAQHGGIFRRPTLAMIGEAGPEAVMPLSRLGNLGGGDTITNHYHFAGFITDPAALRGFVREIEGLQRQEGNRSSFGPSKTTYFSQGGHL